MVVKYVAIEVVATWYETLWVCSINSIEVLEYQLMAIGLHFCVVDQECTSTTSSKNDYAQNHSQVGLTTKKTTNQAMVRWGEKRNEISHRLSQRTRQRRSRIAQTRIWNAHTPPQLFKSSTRPPSTHRTSVYFTIARILNGEPPLFVQVSHSLAETGQNRKNIHSFLSDPHKEADLYTECECPRRQAERQNEMI